MTDVQALFTVLKIAISIFGILLLVFWLYREYCVAAFRQDMFEIRDELFDLAASGQIDFDSPVYGTNRRIINGFLRYAHKMSFPEFLIFSYFHKGSAERASRLRASRREDEEALSSTGLEALRSLQEKLSFSIVRHLLMKSPIFVMTIVLPIAFSLLAGKVTEVIIPRCKPQLDDLNSTALAYGKA